ncbi:catalase [Pseudomaricurvus alkylphenolicus]|uniref:putative metalloprotease CJM1_0395 family protein n=1 Tax=Pseudomaricurvus alkylphenolicus TaxID=1306991 RepID=UPI0014239F48|nr:putative metalloprotease CJM1_0395 family protein [Pseudomaricurvus alkylphenolicus]NIB39242.1 catalase [Pseudomaricurvus alkylphenolicus]
MITPSLPSNLANVITPFSPVGKLPVGEESPESRDTPFKPVEESSETSRQDNRASTAERAAEADQRIDFNEPQQQERDQQQQDLEREELENRARQEVEQQQQRQDQDEIQRLAQRDREVRAHEQAHAAVGGALAGSPSYTYTRGPDGVSYAIAGEVPISTGAVPGDPQATLENARRVQQAALAPAEPSPQDRQVAAEAARLQQQALAEIAAQARQEQREVTEQAEADRLERQEEEERLAAQAEQQEQRTAERAEIEDTTAQTNIDLNRRLIEIGVSEPIAPIGGLFDQIA